MGAPFEAFDADGSIVRRRPAERIGASADPDHD
jgi:hypothetical protein